MDLVDAQILRKLTWHPHDPHDQGRGIMGAWDIARELQIHGTTVKRRIEEMEATGVLFGVQMWPEPSIVGARNRLYAFEFATTEAKDAAVAALDADAEGCTDVYSFIGKEAWFGLTTPATLDPAEVARSIAERFGAASFRAVEDRSWDHQGPTELEGRVLQALWKNAFLPVAQVAEEVGVTPVTVRKKIASLHAKKAYVMYPFLYPGKMRGVIPYMVTAESEGTSSTVRFLQAFPGAIWRCMPNSRRPYVLLAAQDVPEMAESVRLADTLPGVSGARHLLLEHNRPCLPRPEAVQISKYVEAPELLLAEA